MSRGFSINTGLSLTSVQFHLRPYVIFVIFNVFSFSTYTRKCQSQIILLRKLDLHWCYGKNVYHYVTKMSVIRLA